MDQTKNRDLSPRLSAVLLILLIAVGCFRITASYSILNHTFDEAAHFACGLEWLTQGTYDLEHLHPPLARVFLAIGPYLEGIRPVPGDNVWDVGTTELYSHGAYWRNLTATRLGNLPFFVLGCMVVYWWCARFSSRLTAVCAVFLFSTLPPVLGHAGVSTVDMACCASIALAVLCMALWAQRPSPKHAAGLSAALAIAVLCKFSALFYVPAAALAIALAYWLTSRASLQDVIAVIRKRAPHAAIILLMTIFLVWAGYRFSIRKLESVPRFDRVAQRIPALRKVSRIPLPFTEIFLGLTTVMHHNARGYDAYLLGRYSKQGWRLFFPVVLAVKTPIGLLFFAITGMVLAFRKAAPSRSAMQLAAALVPLAMFGIAMSSRINLGVRHILPMYLFLPILAAQAAVWIFRQSRSKPLMAAAAILLSFDLFHTSAAGIDQIAYFNPLAGSHPERVLCESDLDWGQDLHRLSLRLRALGVRKVSIAYFGTARLEEAGLPEFTPIAGNEPVTGYVAISARRLMLDAARDGTFRWLNGIEPRERVGRSIFLYYIDGPRL